MDIDFEILNILPFLFFYFYGCMKCTILPKLKNALVFCNQNKNSLVIHLFVTCIYPNIYISCNLKKIFSIPIYLHKSIKLKSFFVQTIKRMGISSLIYTCFIFFHGFDTWAQVQESR